MFNTALLNARDLAIIAVVAVAALIFFKWAAKAAGINLPEL